MPLPHIPEETSAGCQGRAGTLDGRVRRLDPVLRSQANAPRL